jgi:Tetracyclin repressor-like, C-terminal domain
MTAQGKCCRVGDFDLDRISRELGLGADELEVPMLAHGAASAVAPDEPARPDALVASADDDFIVRLLEAVDTLAAPDLGSNGERMGGEHALEMLHLGAKLRIGRARQPVRPSRRVDVAVVELDTREVAGRPAALRSGRHGSGPRLAGGTRVATRLRRDTFQLPSPVEGLDARAPEPSHAKRQPLQGRVRIRRLFKHQDGKLGEPQLAGEEETDRPGPGDDHVVDGGGLLGGACDPLPKAWRPAIRAIATATRATYPRHAWVLRSFTGARVGPNGLRHIEQSLQAVASIALPIDQKLPILSIVDDYVFGHCAGLTRRRSQPPLDRKTAHALSEAMSRSLDHGDYPQLRGLIGKDDPVDALLKNTGYTTQDRHFNIGLDALLDGLANRFKLK